MLRVFAAPGGRTSGARLASSATAACATGLESGRSPGTARPDESAFAGHLPRAGCRPSTGRRRSSPSPRGTRASRWSRSRPPPPACPSSGPGSASCPISATGRRPSLSATRRPSPMRWPPSSTIRAGQPAMAAADAPSPSPGSTSNGRRAALLARYDGLVSATGGAARDDEPVPAERDGPADALPVRDREPPSVRAPALPARARASRGTSGGRRWSARMRVEADASRPSATSRGRHLPLERGQVQRRPARPAAPVRRAGATDRPGAGGRSRPRSPATGRHEPEVQPLDESAAADQQVARGVDGEVGEQALGPGQGGRPPQDLAPARATPQRPPSGRRRPPAPQVTLDLDMDLDPARVVRVLARRGRRPAPPPGSTKTSGSGAGGRPATCR